MLNKNFRRFCSSGVISYNNNNKNHYIWNNINKMDKILDIKFDKNSLFIFDIDETLFITDQQLNYIPIIKDNTLISTLNNIQNNQSCILCLTARASYNYGSFTFEQFNKINLKEYFNFYQRFNNKLPIDIDLDIEFLDFRHSIFYTDNVIFTGGIHKKGYVFKLFNKYIKSEYNIDIMNSFNNIIFIDDNRICIENMNEYFRDFDTFNSYCIHYTGLTSSNQ